MAELAAVLRVAAFLTLVLVSGWAVARVAKRGADLFASVWWGLAITSMTGAVLARVGWFSLAALGSAGAMVSVVALVVARVRRPTVPPADGPSDPGTVRWVRMLAGCAGLLTCVWTWPPFETFLAGADSTMYLDAGIHLARTGSFTVPDTVARLLPPSLAAALFPSVGIFGQGPYIRLSGGLLMSSLDAQSSTPAFFPLLPVWAGAFAAAGGPAAAAAVAPFGTALAVWAVTLFAGETLGVAAAVPTALVLGANFVVWWFGRFAMSEPLTAAFIWGGLVFLGRGAPFAAGVMLGLGGLARAETLPFTVAAVVWWATWSRVPARVLITFASGFTLVGLCASAGLLAAPSHHLAYLANDIAFAWTRVALRVLPAVWDGRLAAAIVLLPMVPLTAGIVVKSWWGGSLARQVLRVAVLLATLVSLVLYLRLGGHAEPVRHLGWLATAMSPLGLGLAVIGGVIVWRHGGPAARLGVSLVVLVALVFVLNPRVAPYQPWAMRRYLPVVLPGLALAVGAALGSLISARPRGARAAGVVLTLAVVVLQLPPTLGARRQAYYADSLAHARRVAEMTPADALVVVESGFAELQIQVPLWLVYGRESVVVTGGGRAWSELLQALVASGRPVYWIQNRLALPPRHPELSFQPVVGDADFTVNLPDAPEDMPPTRTIRKLVPLGVYGVTAGDGLEGRSSRCMRCLKSSGDVTSSLSCTVYASPLASLPTTAASTVPSTVNWCETISPVSFAAPSPKSQVKVKGGVPFRAFALNVTTVSTGI